MMYCKKCGAKIESIHSFCGVCGEPIQSSTPDPENTEPQSVPGQQNVFKSAMEPIVEGIRMKCEKKYCGKCGAKIAGNQSFCGECGEPVQSTTPAPENTNPQNVPGQQNAFKSAMAPIMEGIRMRGEKKYCGKCGAKIEGNHGFCGECGEPVQSSAPDSGNTNPQNVPGRRNGAMPTKALVTEGIGFLFFLYLVIVNSRADNDLNAEAFIRDSGLVFFFIGLAIVVLSFFMFLRFKKKNTLYGLGYAGYIVSCIGLALLVIFIIIGLFMYIMAFLAMRHLSL